MSLVDDTLYNALAQHFYYSPASELWTSKASCYTCNKNQL